MKKIIIGAMIATTLVYADFTRSSAGVVTDNKTHLEWQDDYSDSDNKIKNTTWSGALNYCHNLELDGGGWRLPNINELKSIIKDKVVGPTIDDAFKNTVSSYYWSSTTRVDGTNYAWDVNFYDGSDNGYNKDGNVYVRCVRDGQ